MESSKVTPKDFFLWAGAMISLYVSVFSLISLFFAYIDRTFTDPLSYYFDPYSTTMRLEIASLLVLFPLFLVLMRFIRKDMEKNPGKKDLWVRRWALFLTVFIAGATVAIDLITLINVFLGGEITTRFVLKIAIVLLVTGAAFMHFLADIWGYWIIYPNRARSVGWAAGALIICTIAAGFFIMGSPNQIREFRFDDQRIGNLQDLSYRIRNYWQLKQKLPQSLTDLNDPISGQTIPVDPKTGQPYEYQPTGDLSFTLCATFGAPTQSNSMYGRNVAMPMPVSMPAKDYQQDSWQHGAGHTCFTRTIDPDLYPPIQKNPSKVPAPTGI